MLIVVSQFLIYQGTSLVVCLYFLQLFLHDFVLLQKHVLVVSELLYDAILCLVVIHELLHLRHFLIALLSNGNGNFLADLVRLLLDAFDLSLFVLKGALLFLFDFLKVLLLSTVHLSLKFQFTFYFCDSVSLLFELLLKIQDDVVLLMPLRLK